MFMTIWNVAGGDVVKVTVNLGPAVLEAGVRRIVHHDQEK
jgi:hypothetical protein